MLGVAAATLAGLTAVIVIHGSGVPDVAAFVTWPQVIVIAALAANMSWAAVQLWIHGDLRPRRRRLLWTAPVAWDGIGVALGPSVFGFFLLGVASVAWLALQYVAGRRM